MSDIKALLEKDLAVSYGSTKTIVVNQQSFMGDFGVQDNLACEDCYKRTHFFHLYCEDKIVSKQTSTNEVQSIRLTENVFQKYKEIPELKENSCSDRLMYTNNKVVIMEMKCLRPQYTDKENSGRPKAYKQLKDSIEKLRHCNDIQKEFDSRKDRLALFALREKTFALEANSQAANNMKKFNQMPNNFQNSKLRSSMGNGFDFVVQKYPNKFVW